MKTPTLIVRLAGLYLFSSSALALLQFSKMTADSGILDGQQGQLLSDFKLYLWSGVIVGLGVTAFAGPLARLLTFDSEPRQRLQELGDRLLKK